MTEHREQRGRALVLRLGQQRVVGAANQGEGHRAREVHCRDLARSDEAQVTRENCIEAKRAGGGREELSAAAAKHVVHNGGEREHVATGGNDWDGGRRLKRDGAL